MNKRGGFGSLVLIVAIIIVGFVIYKLGLWNQIWVGIKSLLGIK